MTIALCFQGWDVAWSADDALDAVVGRLDRLRDFSAHFSMTTSTDFDPALANNDPQIQEMLKQRALNHSETQQCTFRYFKGTAQMISTIDKNQMQAAREGQTLAPELEERAILAERTETLTTFADGAVVGVIDQAGVPFPESWSLGVGLGIRLLKSSKWITAVDLHAAKRSQPSDDELVLTIAGENGLSHEMHFAEKNGFALVSYRVSYPVKGSYEDIACSDFRPVDGVQLPYKIVRRGTYTDSSANERHPYTRTIVVHDYVLDDPTNEADTMMITFPPRTPVLHKPTGTSIRIGGEPTTLPDTKIAELANSADRDRERLEERAAVRIRRALSPTTVPEEATPER